MEAFKISFTITFILMGFWALSAILAILALDSRNSERWYKIFMINSLLLVVTLLTLALISIWVF